jgi:hypothetical protein
LYFSRPNLLSSISTVLLGSPIFWALPSTFQQDLCTEFGSLTWLENRTDAVGGLCEQERDERCREEQNLYKVQVTLLKPNTMPIWDWSTACGSRDGPRSSPSVMVVTFLSKHQDICEPRLQHTIQLGICPTSFKNCTTTPCSLNNITRNTLFGTPLTLSVGCPMSWPAQML